MEWIWNDLLMLMERFSSFLHSFYPLIELPGRGVHRRARLRAELPAAARAACYSTSQIRRCNESKKDSPSSGKNKLYVLFAGTPFCHVVEAICSYLKLFALFASICSFSACRASISHLLPSSALRASSDFMKRPLS